ncbi:MAG: tetratricopeptide repeat protein [Caldilineaceae bacterium]
MNKPLRLNNARHNLAIALTHLGQYSRARRLHQQNLASWRTLHRRSYLAMTLEGLGHVSLMQNRLRLAELHLKAALRFYAELEDYGRRGLCASIWGIGLWPGACCPTPPPITGP